MCLSNKPVIDGERALIRNLISRVFWLNSDVNYANKETSPQKRLERQRRSFYTPTSIAKNYWKRSVSRRKVFVEFFIRKTWISQFCNVALIFLRIQSGRANSLTKFYQSKWKLML